MRRCLLIGVMIVAAQWCVATSFHLPRLQKLATAAHLHLVDSLLGPHIELDSTAIYKGKPVYVRTNAFGDISHIGYRLFAPKMKDSHKGIPVFDFLERYLLELDLKLDGKDPMLRMDIDQVVVIKGSFQQLRQLTPQTPLSIRVEEITRKMYRVLFVFEGKEIQVTIPADNQLLYGGNIIELEQSFIDGVHRMMAIDASALIQEWNTEHFKRKKDTLVIEGGFYRIDAIRGDLYLTKGKHGRQLLMDRKSPLRSVSNLMLTGMGRNEVPMRIDFHVYGNKNELQELSLQQFVSYCKSEGCQLYFGTKTLTDSVLTGTLFAYNEKYAYTHMLSVTVPLEILDNGITPITGHAYVYIPLHDITEKYIK